MYSIVFVVFILYKVALSLDEPYSQLRISNGYPVFDWFSELPLNLCNLGIILTVVGLMADSKPILGFVFFTNSLGAFAAMIVPPMEFSGFSILVPRIAGYYLTHIAVMLIMPILAGLKLFRPRYSDILPVLLALFATTLVITGINLLFIKTGLSEAANYFYTMDPNGISILEFLYKLIPIPWVYQLPLIVIAVPYMLIVSFFFNIKSRKKAA